MTMTTLFSISESTDWTHTGELIGGIIFGLWMAYNTWRQSHIERKVEAVRIQGNSNFGDMLQVGMVAAKTLAETTGKPEHQALAEVAEKRYDQHVANQLQLESKTTGTKG